MGLAGSPPLSTSAFPSTSLRPYQPHPFLPLLLLCRDENQSSKVPGKHVKSGLNFPKSELTIFLLEMRGKGKKIKPETEEPLGGGFISTLQFLRGLHSRPSTPGPMSGVQE